MRDKLRESAWFWIILLFTFIAGVLALVTVRLLDLNPTLSTLAGVGWGILFGVALLVLGRYGSTIDPNAPKEYDESNDFIPEEL